MFCGNVILDCVTVLRICGLLLQTERVCLSVLCLSLCVTIVSPAKMAKPIKMLFGVWVDFDGPSEPCVRWGPGPPCGCPILEGERHGPL